VHSLIAALARYEGIRLILIAPRELKIPSYVKYDIMDRSGMEYVETDSLEEALPKLDLLYMTRIQRERFDDSESYETLKDHYILDAKKMEYAKKDMCVLHPLPRVNEISVAIDADPRACYFKQVLNGKLMRMALILKLLAEKDQPSSSEDGIPSEELCCQNSRCITSVEQELEHRFRLSDPENGIYRCIYCEKIAQRKEEK